MKVAFEAGSAYDTTVILTCRLFNSTLDQKSRTKKWKAEEKRDPVEATVEEAEVMEEEGEAEDIAVEEEEAVAVAMAVEAAVAAMEEEADTGAARVAEEASNAIGAQYL